MSELGAIVYRGPSMLTGDPILGVLTGLEGGSLNAKTGPMVQVWILREDRSPMDAKRLNLDDAICGDCQLRGRDGLNSGCYVVPWNAPRIVWEAAQAGRYLDLGWPDVQALVEGRSIRLSAYGDPAAVPFEVWSMLLAGAAGWTAYTHQWRTCDPRFRTIAMASVDSVAEFWEARDAGWRTFRIRQPHDELLRAASYERERILPIEFVCPASDEAGHITTCQRCQLCRGTSAPARSVAIVAHGKPSSLRVFGLRPHRASAEALVEVHA
jgi:hypothetical protein